MPLKFNIGTSLTAVVTVGGQVIKQFGLHTSTRIVNNWTEEKETPTNFGGLTIARNIFGGYDVEVAVTQQNSVMDDLQQFLQDNYLAGNPEPVVTMLKTVRNTDNTYTQKNYVDGILSVTSGGDFSGTSKVTQTVKMYFPRCLPVAGSLPMTLGNGAIPSGASSL